LFADLVLRNTGLIAANDSYCSVEKDNYTQVKDAIEQQLALFRDIRVYFKDNYSKINKFVKQAYNAPKQS